MAQQRSHVVIIGGGIMGGDIATVYAASGGWNVHVMSPSAKTREALPARVLAGISKLLEPDGRVHILELVLPEGPKLSRLMARLDRGRHARSIEAWKTRFERHFESEVLEPYMFGGPLWAMVYFRGKAGTCGSQ